MRLAQVVDVAFCRQFEIRPVFGRNCVFPGRFLAFLTHLSPFSDGKKISFIIGDCHGRETNFERLTCQSQLTPTPA
jgi:hypothetical protein